MPVSSSSGRLKEQSPRSPGTGTGRCRHPRRHRRPDLAVGHRDEGAALIAALASDPARPKGQQSGATLRASEHGGRRRARARDGRPGETMRFDSGSTRSATARPRAAATRPTTRPRHASTGQTSRCHDHLRRPGGDLQCQRLRFSMSARLIDGSLSPSSPASPCPMSCEVRIRSDGHCMRPAAVRRCCIQTCMTDLGAVLRTCPQMADKRRPADGPERQVKENIAVAQARRSALGSRAARQA